MVRASLLVSYFTVAARVFVFPTFATVTVTVWSLVSYVTPSIPSSISVIVYSYVPTASYAISPNTASGLVAVAVAVTAPVAFPGIGAPFSGVSVNVKLSAFPQALKSFVTWIVAFGVSTVFVKTIISVSEANTPICSFVVSVVVPYVTDVTKPSAFISSTLYLVPTVKPQKLFCCPSFRKNSVTPPTN